MSRGESERDQKEATEAYSWRGERGKSYLNDIVAGVHARRLALIAPLERPCYPCYASGTRKADSSTSAISDVCP